MQKFSPCCYSKNDIISIFSSYKLFKLMSTVRTGQLSVSCCLDDCPYSTTSSVVLVRRIMICKLFMHSFHV